jgi:hypothetical protein
MKIGQTNINDQIIVTTQKVLVENHINKEEPKSDGNNFNSIKYWEERYFNGGNSGNGSYGFLAEYKKDFINQFIIENNIKSLLEYGCGDCNQLSMIKCDDIIGVDVSKTVINICQNLLPNSTFIDLTVQEFPKIKSDLLLSLDVIYHLIEDNIYEEYIKNIVNYGSDHLIIYSSNFENDSIYAKHVKPRNFTKNEKLLKKYDLKKIIENKYKSEDHTKGSFSDWYIFKIKNKK